MGAAAAGHEDAPRSDGAGLVVPRGMMATGSSVACSAGWPLRRSSSCSAAPRPISTVGSRTAVSGDATLRAKSKSSKPVIEISPGTSTPAARHSNSAPSASTSLTLSAAVGRGLSASRRRMASRASVTSYRASTSPPSTRSSPTGLDEAALQDVVDVKRALTRVLAPHASALLTEPLYGYWSGFAATPPHCGLMLTLEDHTFRETAEARLSAEIANWSVEKIKRLGADAVKILACYRPDAAPEIRAHQQAFVRRVGEACRRHDICHVLELLVYSLPHERRQTRGYVEQTGKRPQLVIDSVRDFADPGFGVDLFKLESPLEASALPDPEAGPAERVVEAQALFAELGRAAARPWVMLSAGAGMHEFERVLRYAYAVGASGYLAGRAIRWEAVQGFPDIAAVERGLETEAVPTWNVSTP